MEPRDPEYRDRIVTIPNIICGVRLAGAFLMIAIAVMDYPRIFVVMFAVLSLSDWIDGKLARWLHQRSDFGARLDSFADSALYASLLIGSCVLRWDVLHPELPWMAAGLASYCLTTGYGLWKFSRVPSYHTYGAKMTFWLILTGAVCLLTDVSVWPFRVAMVSVTLTNLEATAITFVLKEWQADILTILHVLPKSETHDADEQ